MSNLAGCSDTILECILAGSSPRCQMLFVSGPAHLHIFPLAVRFLILNNGTDIGLLNVN